MQWNGRVDTPPVIYETTHQSNTLSAFLKSFPTAMWIIYIIYVTEFAHYVRVTYRNHGT